MLRCLPLANDSYEFADASCTQRVVDPSRPGATASGALVTLAESHPGAPLPTYVVRHLGMPYTGASLFTETPSGCTGSSPRPDGSSYFFVSEPVAPGEFEAAIVHD